MESRHDDPETTSGGLDRTPCSAPVDADGRRSLRQHAFAKTPEEFHFHRLREDLVRNFERQYILLMLDIGFPSLTALAEAAGLSRRHARTLLNKHGFEEALIGMRINNIMKLAVYCGPARQDFEGLVRTRGTEVSGTETYSDGDAR
jgi:hypothetical protein